MSIFNIFRKKIRKQTPAEKFRMSVRNGLETFVAKAIKDCYNRFPPVEPEAVLPKAIDNYIETIKNSKEFAIISMATMSEYSWDPHAIIEEEKQRILNKLQYGK